MSEPDADFKALVDTLGEGLQSEALPSVVAQFQRLVFNSKKLIGATPDQEEILRTLAYDLDFFEPNPEWRREDPSLYGPERARTEIQEALAALGAL